ncbi:MAG: two-component system, sensor histidine kinase GlnK [Clostridiales bacterium]|nr:two-component system, sensor histidine kinase GlnK [Clostridiales bacterium]
MINDRFQKVEQIFIVATFTTFMGQIYLSPFGTEFRLTLAVVVLNVLMLTFREIEPILTINLVGIMMFAVRSGLNIIGEHASIAESIQLYYPVLFFYIFYSFFFSILDVRGKLKHPVLLFISIWLCDSIPNLIEVSIRQEWAYSNFESVVLTIISIGLFRTVFTTGLIYISNRYYEHVKRRQEYQRFREQLMQRANLKTELFFLRKSKQDIENAMQKSFSIYEGLEAETLKEAILDVTKDIHEIKKDYTRVIAGIERSIDEIYGSVMPLSEIAQIAVEANEKLATANGKHIQFIERVSVKGSTHDYYVLLSILNNLLVNSIEAIDTEGRIQLLMTADAEMIIIKVCDSGNGISAEDQALIFEPGYSTKYNAISGIMASGIGLTHVKYLVSQVLGGAIEVESSPGRETCFTVAVPKQHLLTDVTSS